MIRYVAIGAVVGFLVAFFLLSHGSEAPSLPPVQGAQPARLPELSNPAERMQLQRLPENLRPRRLPIEAASDAG